MNNLNSISLHALVIKLTALDAGTLPGSAGELAHAAFYAAIEAVDPALSAQMHDAQNRKDFALSPLYGFWRSPADGRIHVNPGQEGWLRLSLLNERLFGVFMQHLLGSSRPSIRLGSVRFAITEVLGSPGSHAWVGYATIEQLQALDERPSRWTLEFESPTAIRWGQADDGTRRVEVFPQPRPAIAGLRSRWDKLTGESLGPGLRGVGRAQHSHRAYLALGDRALSLSQTDLRRRSGQVGISLFGHVKWPQRGPFQSSAASGLLHRHRLQDDPRIGPSSTTGVAHGRFPTALTHRAIRLLSPSFLVHVCPGRDG